MSFLLISGDSFYYAQYIFTMQQFREEEVTIDIPNATVIFPVGFDEQIARVWWGHIWRGEWGEREGEY